VSEDNLERAIKSTEDLTEAVNLLARRAVENKEGIERGRRRDNWQAAILGLLAVMIVGMGIGGYFIDRNQDQISEIQRSQEAETRLNRSSQCAMVNMFLSYETATNRSAVLSPEEKAQRNQGYLVIHKIHDDLGCVNE
jgi:hypothetical protein